MSTRHLRFLPGGFQVAAFAAVALSVTGFAGTDQFRQANGLATHSNAPAYLSLGDSYPYGSDGSDFLPHNDNYWVGYPDYLAALLERPLVNAACPGETTSSLLTGIFEPESHCPAAREARLLHMDYAGSQMEFAEEYLTTHDRVVLVTLTIGGNDFQDFARQCGGSPACLIAGLPAFENMVGANIETALSTIRNTGYSGQIIYVPYASTNFNGGTAVLMAHIFQAIVPVLEAYGAEMAPVFARFRAEAEPYGGDSCAAGLLMTNADGSCNIHPTDFGHRLIAAIIGEMVQ